MSILGQIHDLEEKILTVRLLEERLQKLCDQGLAGDLHFNKGQEAIAVGVCAALGDGDRIVTHHRTIAHAVARGIPLRPLVAELLGRRTGLRGGRAGEMHLSSREHGYDFSFQLVGTCIPVAAGFAWGRRRRKERGTVVVFFGDAATGNGQFHEGLSLIAIHKLPVLLVCENNARAGNITQEHYMPVPSPVERAIGYGIPWAVGDGSDVFEVYTLARSALETHDERPFFLQLDCERLCYHKQGQRDDRTAEELALASKRDPLRRSGPTVMGRAEAIGAELDAIIESVMADPPAEYP